MSAIDLALVLGRFEFLAWGVNLPKTKIFSKKLLVDTF